MDARATSAAHAVLDQLALGGPELAWRFVIGGLALIGQVIAGRLGVLRASAHEEMREQRS
jgi:hypothetical protein